MLAMGAAQAQHVGYMRSLPLVKVVELSKTEKMKVLSKAGLNYPQLQGVCTFTPTSMWDEKNKVELQVQGGMYSGQGPMITLGGLLNWSALTVDGMIDPTKHYLVTFYGENLQDKPSEVEILGGHQTDTMKLPKGTFSIPMVYFQRAGFPDFGVAIRVPPNKPSIYIYKVTLEKAG